MFGLAKVIFLKELRETIRDRRVMLGVIVSPLLLTPALMGVVLFFAGKKAVEQQTAILDVGIVYQEDFPELQARLEASDALNLQVLDSREAAVAAIRAYESRAALLVPSQSRKAFLESGTAELEILYDRANENSANAQRRLKQILKAFNSEQALARLEARDLPATLLQPTRATATSIASQTAVIGFALSMFLPYIVVMGASFGGMNTAFDLCAGEKERGTMETLLVSPASRYEIAQGKLLAIFAVSLLGAVCSILGILGALGISQQLVDQLFGESASISYASLLALVFVAAPLALLSAAGLLLVSAFARSQKEAQAYVFPYIAIFLFPAALSFILGAESPLYTALIPVLNIALSMKQLLSDTFDPTHFSLTLATSIGYAAIAIFLAGRFFQKEAVLFRS